MGLESFPCRWSQVNIESFLPSHIAVFNWPQNGLGATFKTTVYNSVVYLDALFFWTCVYLDLSASYYKPPFGSQLRLMHSAVLWSLTLSRRETSQPVSSAPPSQVPPSRLDREWQLKPIEKGEKLTADITMLNLQVETSHSYCYYAIARINRTKQWSDDAQHLQSSCTCCTRKV